MTKNEIRSWARSELGRPMVIDRVRGQWRLRCTVTRMKLEPTVTKMGDKEMMGRSVVIRLEAKGRRLASAHAVMLKGCQANPIVFKAMSKRRGIARGMR